MASYVGTSIANGDGRIRTVNKATWAAAHDASSGDDVSNSQISDPVTARKDAANDWGVIRLFLPFDTSAIPAAATISSGTLSLSYDGGGILNADTDFVNLVSSTQASAGTLVVGDFSKVGATSGGSISFAGITTGTLTNNIALNATGLGFITKEGTTFLALRAGRDLSNTAPTGVNQVGGFVTSNNGTTAMRPTLTLNYTSGGGLDLTSKMW